MHKTANNRVQRTLHKVSGPLTRDVVRRNINVMKFAWAVTLLMTMLTPSSAYSAEVLNGLSDSQFESALRNISTAPNYILVTVVNGNTGYHAPVCMEAEFLLSALNIEYNLKWAEAVAFALAQPNRTFKFSNTNALSRVERAYSDQTLQDARDFLGNMTVDEIHAATIDQNSTLYEFCAREPGAYGIRFPAIAHVLSERGILCGRSCKPGLFYIENGSAQQGVAGYGAQGAPSPER